MIQKLRFLSWALLIPALFFLSLSKASAADLSATIEAYAYTVEVTGLIEENELFGSSIGEIIIGGVATQINSAGGPTSGVSITNGSFSGTGCPSITARAYSIIDGGTMPDRPTIKSRISFKGYHKYRITVPDGVPGQRVYLRYSGFASNRYWGCGDLNTHFTARADGKVSGIYVADGLNYDQTAFPTTWNYWGIENTKDGCIDITFPNPNEPAGHAFMGATLDSNKQALVEIPFEGYAASRIIEKKEISGWHTVSLNASTTVSTAAALVKDQITEADYQVEAKPIEIVKPPAPIIPDWWTLEPHVGGDVNITPGGQTTFKTGFGIAVDGGANGKTETGQHKMVGTFEWSINRPDLANQKVDVKYTADMTTEFTSDNNRNISYEYTRNIRLDNILQTDSPVKVDVPAYNRGSGQPLSSVGVQLDANGKGVAKIDWEIDHTITLTAPPGNTGVGEVKLNLTTRVNSVEISNSNKGHWSHEVTVDGNNGYSTDIEPYYFQSIPMGEKLLIWTMPRRAQLASVAYDPNVAVGDGPRVQVNGYAKYRIRRPDLANKNVKVTVLVTNSNKLTGSTNPDSSYSSYAEILFGDVFSVMGGGLLNDAASVVTGTYTQGTGSGNLKSYGVSPYTTTSSVLSHATLDANGEATIWIPVSVDNGAEVSPVPNTSPYPVYVTAWADNENSLTLEVTNISEVVTQTSATYVGSDTTTQGNWKGVYGANGYQLAASPFTGIQSFMGFSNTGVGYTWQDPSTSDVRTLLKEGTSTDRVASCWAADSGQNSFDLNTNILDGSVRQVSIYMLDWDNQGRGQRVNVYNAATNALLDSRLVTNFGSGVYLKWNVSGNVRFTISHEGGGINSVASGIFID